MAELKWKMYPEGDRQLGAGLAGGQELAERLSKDA